MSALWKPLGRHACCLARGPRCRALIARARLIAELLAAHQSHPNALGTMLVKRVPEAKARECGEVVADAATCELLHYIERPETCVMRRNAWLAVR